MPLSIGIVGLPNVGKSTTFNALTGAQNAEVANYPFCTIKPNKAIVPLPDIRVETIAELIGVTNSIHATIEFVDIAGLVKGASKGEGLGNKFLGNIRDTDAIVHVVRCFDDANVAHTSEIIDPIFDIETVKIELILSDLQQLDRKIERLSRQIKGDKRFQTLLEISIALRDHLQNSKLISTFPNMHNEAYKTIKNEMRFLTSKPVIYAANVDEAGFSDDNEYVNSVKKFAIDQNSEFLVLCAKLEEELGDLPIEEQKEYLELIGVKESGLDQIIRKGFYALGLISFFTKNEDEVRAWNVPQNTRAQNAAGVIHTDFERGFIKAEVISFDTFVEYGSDIAAKSGGAMRLEGKDYLVQDGDIIQFRFNV